MKNAEQQKEVVRKIKTTEARIARVSGKLKQVLENQLECLTYKLTCLRLGDPEDSGYLNSLSEHAVLIEDSGALTLVKRVVAPRETLAECLFNFISSKEGSVTEKAIMNHLTKHCGFPRIDVVNELFAAITSRKLVKKYIGSSKMRAYSLRSGL